MSRSAKKKMQRRNTVILTDILPKVNKAIPTTKAEKADAKRKKLVEAFKNKKVRQTMEQYKFIRLLEAEEADQTKGDDFPERQGIKMKPEWTSLRTRTGEEDIN